MEEEKMNEGELTLNATGVDKTPIDFEETNIDSDTANPFQVPSKSTSEEIDEETKLVNKSSDYSATGNKLKKNGI